MDVVTTGIRPLDIFLGGGLPVGSTTILLAPSGAGAEIFAKQFAAGDSSAATVYISTDEGRQEVLDAARLAGWDFTHVRIEDVQTRFAEQMLHMQRGLRKALSPQQPQRSFDPRALVEASEQVDFAAPRDATATPDAMDAYDYLGQLLDPFSEERPPGRVVIHSLDFYLNLYPVEKAVAAFTAIKAANARAQGQMLWVLAKGAHGATTERRLELLADCLIELEMTRKGTTFERFCVVKKVKNRSQGVGVSTYEIGADGFHLETLERIV